MTYEIDYSAWPLVRVRADGLLSVDGAQIAVSAFEALLERRQPFAVAYDGGEAGSPLQGAGPVVWNWILRRRADLDAYCVGWASYLPDERARADLERRYGRPDAAAMPVRAFATWPETEAWASDRARRTVHT